MSIEFVVLRRAELGLLIILNYGVLLEVGEIYSKYPSVV